MKRFKSVSEYIAKAPSWAKGTLKEIQKTIKGAAPSAKESLSYNMPYYNQKGRVAYFAAFKNHTSFFWISASDKKNFKKDLATKNVVGSTLQIPKGGKVPKGIIQKIVRARVKANEAKKKIK